ncbi:MAG: DUF4416 family protein [Deltaproteobacteria bacterium]|nr:MAG: DUF4416 family protein [Deltaproteobacteria bacterium]
MSTPRQPKPAKLFVSVISAAARRISATLSELTALYGTLDFVSALLPFNYTNYYHAEMGQPLVRRYASFDGLIQQEDLALIKLQTNLLEEKLSVEKNRTVNIDPGYLLAERLVLASGKNYAHRIYLGHGIYADLTLVYQNKDYRPLSWTYVDYAEPKVRAWLRALRQKYLLQLRGVEQGEKNRNTVPEGGG